MQYFLYQVVVPSDITDLLLNEESFVPSATSGGQSTSDPASSIDGYRKLLLEGRRKVCNDYAYRVLNSNTVPYGE